MKKMRRYLILFSLVCLGACKQNASENTNENEQTNPATVSLQKVGVINPKERSFYAEVSVTGTAMPNQVVKIQAMESGFVQSIQKDIGDYVAKGSVIAILQNPELSSRLKEQQAHLKRAEAMVLKYQAELKKSFVISKSKKVILDRLETTYIKAPNIVLVADVDIARAEYETALVSTMTSEANIAVANGEKEAAIAVQSALQIRHSMLRVKAPFSGIISKRFVDNGATIMNGLSSTTAQSIVEIQDISTIRLSVHLPESDATHISKGSEVNISFPELSSQVNTATVSRSSNTLDPVSKNMLIQIDIDNKDGKIKPGMFAKVILNAQNRNDILSIPVTAKMLIEDVPHILIVDKGQVKAIKLNIGMEGKEYLEVFNAEINSSTQIILQGKNLVKAGQKVEAKLINE